jgi:hypothetical protein
MPRNSSGVYSLPASDVNPPVALSVIDPVAFANEEQDIAAEITDSLDRLGRGAMLAILQMGGFRIAGLGAAVSATDATSLSDVRGYLPAGAIQNFAMSTPPVGWLECDGSAVSRTGQAAVFGGFADQVYGAQNSTSHLSSTASLEPVSILLFPAVWPNSHATPVFLPRTAHADRTAGQNDTLIKESVCPSGLTSRGQFHGVRPCPACPACFVSHT